MTVELMQVREHILYVAWLGGQQGCQLALQLDTENRLISGCIFIFIVKVAEIHCLNSCE